MCGITPPPAIVALIRVSSSSSPDCRPDRRGNHRLTFRKIVSAYKHGLKQYLQIFRNILRQVRELLPKIFYRRIKQNY